MRRSSIRFACYLVGSLSPFAGSLSVSAQLVPPNADPRVLKQAIPAKPQPAPVIRPVIRNVQPKPVQRPVVATPAPSVVRKQVQKSNPAPVVNKAPTPILKAPTLKAPTIKAAVPKKIVSPGPGSGGPSSDGKGSGGTGTAAKKLVSPVSPPVPVVTAPNLPGKGPVGLAPPKGLPGPLPNAGKLALPNAPKGFNPNWLAKPAPGLATIKPLMPPKVVLLPPKLPPVPPPKWAGPPWGLKAPKLSWYPWGGRSYFPYFFVGTVATVGVAVVGYNYWSAPPPSCYAAGSVIYYYPGTKVCFNFATAREEDPFECHGKVFRWRPTKYRTVETLIEAEAPQAVVAETWIAEDPQRVVEVRSAIDRAAAAAQTVAMTPLDQLDCSTCLSALGPTQGDNGQCTVSLVNNCDHEVTVSGGLSKTAATPDTPTVCDFQGDVAAGAEVAACTRPCGEFTDAQIFLNAVIPVAGTAKPAPSCRIPQKAASAN